MVRSSMPTLNPFSWGGVRYVAAQRKNVLPGGNAIILATAVAGVFQALLPLQHQCVVETVSLERPAARSFSPRRLAELATKPGEPKSICRNPWRSTRSKNAEVTMQASSGAATQRNAYGRECQSGTPSEIGGVAGRKTLSFCGK